MKVYISLLVIPVLLNSCLAPVNTTFDRAATLGKNKFEVNGSIAHHSIDDDGTVTTSNNNYGGRIGIGVSEKTDLKIRFRKQ